MSLCYPVPRLVVLWFTCTTQTQQGLDKTLVNLNPLPCFLGMVLGAKSCFVTINKNKRPISAAMVNYNAEVDDCGICIDGLASPRQHCGAAQVPVAYYSSARSLDASWPSYCESSCSRCEYQCESCEWCCIQDCWEEWETSDERHSCERCAMNLHELEQVRNYTLEFLNSCSCFG